jgi:fatty-acid desaturase
MKTQAWHRTLGAWLVIPTVIGCVYIHTVDVVYYLLSIAVYISIAITITAGYHRLFAHNSYTCAKIWHYIFGFVGAASLNSCPVHWSATNTSHHKFSDTAQDPYDSTFGYFLRLRDRTNIVPTRNEVRMLKDPYHKFLMDHSLTLSILVGAATLTFGFDIFLFGYALPVTGYLVTSGVHTIISHASSGPKNMAILELIIPMAGEWLHWSHHNRPGASYFQGGIDLGGYFIKLIKHEK